MGRQIFFFTTPKDITNILSEISKDIPLQLARTGTFTKKEIEERTYVKILASLGVNISGEHQIESYLLMKDTDDIMVREKTILNGEKKYFIDQRENEQSVVLWPGGLYFNEAIVCGHIASIYQNEFEKNFFRTARKAFKKYCLTFEKYYIGKDAYSLKGKIRFVTMNINEPKEYDLILKD